MLVLTRRKDQSVIIGLPDGRTIRLMVVEEKTDGYGPRLRLGFDAPADVGVWREECCPGGIPPRSLAQKKQPGRS